MSPAELDLRTTLRMAVAEAPRPTVIEVLCLLGVYPRQREFFDELIADNHNPDAVLRTSARVALAECPIEALAAVGAVLHAEVASVQERFPV